MRFLQRVNGTRSAGCRSAVRWLIAAALASGGAARAAAQVVERTDVPARGALRVSFIPLVETWEQVFTANGRLALGAPLTGDSVGTAIGSVARLETGVRAATGLSGFVASLGRGLHGIRSERRTLPLTLEFGVTRRLSIGATVPLVRVNTRQKFVLDTTRANLGVNPLLANPADSASYDAFFAGLDQALTDLEDSVAAGAYGCPGSPSCARANEVLAEGQLLRSTLADATYGTAADPALFMPTQASDGGQAITGTVAGLATALADTFGIQSWATQSFPLPASVATPSEVNALFQDPVSGLGLAPFEQTPKRELWFLGDVEVQAKYRLIERGDYALALAALVRLPTGHQDSPNNIYDLATGDHQTDIELRVIQELTLWRRLWLNLSLRGVRQMAGERDRRLTPWTAPFVSRATLSRLRWDPGDQWAVDFAPMYRFTPEFGAGATLSYAAQGMDRYTFRTPQDSLDLTARLGTPVSAAVLEDGTGLSRFRVGVAVTYAGPRMEGGFSLERTVSGDGGPVPVKTVARIVLKYQIPLF